jgi:Mg2+/Co2+ transporter CorB
MSLLGQTDRLLGVILLGNTLVAAAAATLTAVITKRLFGEGELALSLGTLAISFALLGLLRDHAEGGGRPVRRSAGAPP